MTFPEILPYLRTGELITREKWTYPKTFIRTFNCFGSIEVERLERDSFSNELRQISSNVRFFYEDVIADDWSVVTDDINTICE